jgi:hypothetical protein
MTDNKKNDNLMSQVDSQFRRTYAANYAWADALSAFGSLPGLRGFWPMSTVDNGGNAIDHSNLVKTLTYNGAPTYNHHGLAPYANFIAGTSDYLSRADEADLDILGTETFITAALRGLTMGGWFYFANAPGAVETLISKWGAGQEAYILQRLAGGTISFGVNAGFAATTTTVTAASAWYWLVGRFDPSTETAVFINDTEKVTNLVAIPAAINNTNANLNIGAQSAANFLTGRAAYCFLCAAALPDYMIYSLYHISRALFGR